ncbi:MAG: hypothetical protein RRC34_05020 [Lentisphaeria bacterium]|nr:hypothetical protein [Lentisphaeria bacterium]
MKDTVLRVLLAAGALLVSGCATNREALRAFNASFEQGRYEAADDVAGHRINKKNPHKALLWNLQGGTTRLLLGDFAGSVTLYDQAEAAFKFYDLDSTAENAVQLGAALALNDSFAPYQGEEYDRIMVNSYKGLCFAALGDYENARVEFNRALQRQEEAKHHFARQIKKTKTELAKQDSLANRQAVDGTGAPFSVTDTLESDSFKDAMRETYSNLDTFQAYPDFINPFATYLAGLFFLLEGDTGKASGILKESFGMDPDHPVVRADFADAEAGRAPKGQCWVIFENGLCVERVEFRLDIPIFLVTRELKMVNVAFPVLSTRGRAVDSLSISTATETARTIAICDMDRVIRTEFKKDLTMIIGREVARQAAKTYLQYMVQREYGDLGGIIMAVFQTFSTAADTRSWTALPSDIQVARFPISPDRRLTVSDGGRLSIPVQLPACDNAIVHVRLPQVGVPAAVSIIKF